MRCLLAAMAMVALSASPAWAQATELQPASNWLLDYADDSCALVRQFGDAQTKVRLEMRRYEPDSDGTEFIVSSRDLGLRKVRNSEDVTVRMLPGNGERTFGWLYNIESSDGSKGVIFESNLIFKYPDEIQPDDDGEYQMPNEQRHALEAAVSAIGIDHAFKDDIVLHTGPMQEPMEAMRGCLDELLHHWGIDVEAHRSLTRKVKPVDQEIWVARFVKHYPESLLWHGEQTILRIRLDVSPEGEPTACNIQNGMGNEEFEELACDLLLENARFDPALDALGEPVASYHVLSIHYRVRE